MGDPLDFSSMLMPIGLMSAFSMGIFPLIYGLILLKKKCRCKEKVSAEIYEIKRRESSYRHETGEREGIYHDVTLVYSYGGATYYEKIRVTGTQITKFKRGSYIPIRVNKINPKELYWSDPAKIALIGILGGTALMFLLLGIIGSILMG